MALKFYYLVHYYLKIKTYIMAKATAKKAAASSTAKAGSSSASPLSPASSKGSSSSNSNAKAEDTGLLEKFFVDGLKDIYWAEKALTKALPKMQKAATTDQLKTAFGEHLEVTKNQVARLEQVFESLGKKPQAVKCEAMAGLIKESESIIAETEKGTLTRDVALIMAGQKVEHYEIATYGGLATLAATLGKTDAKELLGQTLQEEKDTDALLSDIAENSINFDAQQED